MGFPRYPGSSEATMSICLCGCYIRMYAFVAACRENLRPVYYCDVTRSGVGSASACLHFNASLSVGVSPTTPGQFAAKASFPGNGNGTESLSFILVSATNVQLLVNWTIIRYTFSKFCCISSSTLWQFAAKSSIHSLTTEMVPELSMLFTFPLLLCVQMSCVMK